MIYNYIKFYYSKVITLKITLSAGCNSMTSAEQAGHIQSKVASP